MFNYNNRVIILFILIVIHFYYRDGSISFKKLIFFINNIEITINFIDVYLNLELY